MKKISVIIFSFLLLFTISSVSSAQILQSDAATKMGSNADLVGATGGLTSSSVGTIVATLIQTLLGLLAIIFLVLMVFAGFQWMTAAGDAAKITKAQDTIKAAVIGLIVVLAAYAITYFIFKYLPFTSSAVGGGPQVITSGKN